MIVSIYLEEHIYLIEKPQTLNFGGKYSYSFRIESGDLVINRKLNKKYIPKFFNISKSHCSLHSLAAVVGENGIGKSSILDIIRSIFIENSYSMPYSRCTVLVEVNEETYILKSVYDKIYLEIELDNRENNRIKISKVDREEYQSIYYSPHFDLKYNNDFDEVDKYDISLDQFIKQDLKYTDEKGTNKNGWKFSLHDELLLKNSMRQIEFLNSSIFKDNHVFRKVFDLPQYETGILHFRDVEINDFHNTPISLRNIITLILERLEKENKKSYSKRIFDERNRVENQVEVNKYLLKRFIIKAFLSIVIKQMEKSNTWLDEGRIDAFDGNEFKDSEAIDIFYYFIENSYILYGDQRNLIFNFQSIHLFFEKLIELIEKENDKYNVETQSIRLNLDELENILELHKEIMTNLFHYYSGHEELIHRGDYIDGLLYFRPTDRNMSSGENALLNFFSKLYSFIQNNLIEESKFLPDKENYVLLLDEADLGFHPLWKKRYIDAILKTLPHFFENLNVKPNLQIIITTHDPLTLSDLPIDNVVFLHKVKGYCSVIPDDNDKKIQRTFGANITDLLAHSFFVEEGLIGNFSKSKIKEVIDWINDNKNLSGAQKSDPKFTDKLLYYKKVVNLIDEKIVKIKLVEMITDLVPDNTYYNQVIDEEVEFLNSKKK